MDTMDGLGLSPSEVEVMSKPVRRRYTAEYKLRILREAEVSSGRGEIGALLRREGLYSFNLTQWRKQRDAGADTSELEHEIDRHCYALYGLTPEEIQIVEASSH